MLTSFQLKLIAILAMTIDHIGCIFFPQATWMRVVGRLAMPIFSFLIAEGFRHTSNVKKYARRLLFWGILSTIPFYLAFGWTQNVYFSLLSGLLALIFMEKAKEKKDKILFFFLFSLLATLLLCDWFFVGVLMVVGFYYAKQKPKGIFLTLLGATLSMLLVFGAYGLYLESMRAFTANLMQLGILLAFPVLSLYNGREGKKTRHFFYAFYPLHLLILWGIDTFFN